MSATSVGREHEKPRGRPEDPRDGSRCASRARPRAREESAVSVVSKLSRPGLLDSNTTGNMIIVLSAGGSASVLGSGRDDARAKDAPRNGAAGVDSRSGGVAHAPLREASVAISRRSRTTEAARARATASTLRRGASRAEVTKGRVSLAPSFHHGEAAVSGQTGPFFSRRWQTQPPLTRTISAARESAESPAPSTPVPPSRPGTRCGRRRRRPRLEARAPFRALVSL